MTATERKKYAEIYERHMREPVSSTPEIFDAMLEARDLARREALLEASALCFKRAGGMPCTAMELGTAIRSLMMQWEGRDYGDGWITFKTETEAKNYREVTGAEIRQKVAPAPPDTEAWKRVPVEAGMFRQAYISAAAETGRTRTPPDLEDFISAIERAARAKLGE